MKRLHLIVLIFCVLVPRIAYCHIDGLQISVIEFYQNADNEYILSFQAEDNLSNDKYLETKLRKYVVHIQFDEVRAKRYEGLSLSLEEHKKALELLEKQIFATKSLHIGRMSSKGYTAIQGKKGHYKTIALKVYSLKNGENYVCFFH